MLKKMGSRPQNMESLLSILYLLESHHSPLGKTLKTVEYARVVNKPDCVFEIMSEEREKQQTIENYLELEGAPKISSRQHPTTREVKAC